jgi:SAM-dependent methyltransferase
MEERFAFDQIANVYKVARPGYPEALIEDVVAYADLKQSDHILEVGCGTGQATKSLAKRGFPIVAAQSWHWVSPEMRFTKATEALSPNGSLAVFGHVPVGLAAESLLAQFKDIYLRQTGKWGPPPEAWYLPTGPVKGSFDESGLFGPVEHRRYPWKWRRTTLSFTDFLRTRPEYVMMEPAKREEMLGEIAKAIDDQGGELTLDYETHLYIARRLNRD